VDGVIVGNTTKRRNIIPQGTELSAKERQILEEQGGYSGPQMFERTLGLVKRYRRLLDQGPPSPPEKEDTSKPVRGAPSGDEPASTIIEKIQSAKDSLTDLEKVMNPRLFLQRAVSRMGNRRWRF